MTRLAQTEQIRQDTASHIALRKRGGGAAASLGALGRWAAGGMGVPDTPKSEEEAAQEADRRMEATSREGVIWFLQDRLRVAGEVQAGMMDVRISREVERSKSVLYKSKVAASSAAAGAGVGASGGAGAGLEEDVAAAENADRAPEMQLSQEQLQLFAQENQDMLKHYEDTLSQVRYVYTTERQMTGHRMLTTLPSQERREVAHRDIRATVDSGSQLTAAERAHRSACARFIPYHGERGEG